MFMHGLSAIVKYYSNITIGCDTHGKATRRRIRQTMPGPYDSSRPNKLYHCDQEEDRAKGDLSSFPGRHNNVGIPLWQLWQAPSYTDRHSYYTITDAASNLINPYATNNAAFPIKLHLCLTEIKKAGLEHIVSWMPHGRAFKVHDKDAFVKSVLPRFFSQSSYESFQRQLNLYDFTRITGGNAIYDVCLCGFLSRLRSNV